MPGRSPRHSSRTAALRGRTSAAAGKALQIRTSYIYYRYLCTTFTTLQAKRALEMELQAKRSLELEEQREKEKKEIQHAVAANLQIFREQHAAAGTRTVVYVVNIGS